MGVSFPITIMYPDGSSAAFSAPLQASVLVSAMKSRVYIRHDCGGKAQCGTCRVTVLEGKVVQKGERELALLEKLHADVGERLACQLHAMAPLVLRAKFNRNETSANTSV